MEEKNVDYSILHLKDKTCKGQLDSKTHMVTFDFKSDTCDTELTVGISSLITDSQSDPFCLSELVLVIHVWQQGDERVVSAVTLSVSL